MAKLRKVKLVATDLDGTLLNNRGQVSDATRESVRKLKHLGIGVAILTGRAHSSAERIADELELETPIVSLDGGLVRLPHTKENIFSSYINPKIVTRVLNEAEARFYSVALFVDDKMVRHESEVFLPGYIDSLELDSVTTDDLSKFAGKAIRIFVGASLRGEVSAIARSACGLFSRVGTSIYRSSREDNKWYLEIKNRVQSKATGLAHLEKYLQINKEEVAVLGDFENDVKAFGRAGIGIAMKNAVHELKERADWVTNLTNDEGGASEFLDLIYGVRANHD